MELEQSRLWTLEAYRHLREDKRFSQKRLQSRSLHTCLTIIHFHKHLLLVTEFEILLWYDKSGFPLPQQWLLLIDQHDIKKKNLWAWLYLEHKCMVPYSAQCIFLSQVLIIYTYFHPKFHSSVFSIGSGSKTRPKEGYLIVLLCPPLCPFEPALPTSSLHWQSPDHTEQVCRTTIWKPEEWFWSFWDGL